jgi:2-keto-4-pentenoate hydratase
MHRLRTLTNHLSVPSGAVHLREHCTAAPLDGDRNWCFLVEGTRGLAERIWRARVESKPIASLEGAEVKDIEAAYAVHANFIQASTTAGWTLGPLAGWKCGATSVKGYQGAGLLEPLRGPLFATTILGNNSKVQPLISYPAIVEAEFGFVLKKVLPPRGKAYKYQPKDLWEAAGEVVCCIEVVGLRLSAPDTPFLAKIADFALNHAVVRGNSVEVSKAPRALDQVAVSLQVNGKEVGTATGAAVLDHPINSLTWLANHLADRGLQLQPGQLVITGATCLFREAKQGDKIRATFSSLGEVTCTL